MTTTAATTITAAASIPSPAYSPLHCCSNAIFHVDILHGMLHTVSQIATLRYICTIKAPTICQYA